MDKETCYKISESTLDYTISKSKYFEDIRKKKKDNPIIDNTGQTCSSKCRVQITNPNHQKLMIGLRFIDELRK